MWEGFAIWLMRSVAMGFHVVPTTDAQVKAAVVSLVVHVTAIISIVGGDSASYKMKVVFRFKAKTKRSISVNLYCSISNNISFTFAFFPSLSMRYTFHAIDSLLM